MTRDTNLPAIVDDREAMIEYIAELETRLQAQSQQRITYTVQPTPQSNDEWLRQAPAYSKRSITYSTSSTPLPWVILLAVIAFGIYAGTHS